MKKLISILLALALLAALAACSDPDPSDSPDITDPALVNGGPAQVDEPETLQRGVQEGTEYTNRILKIGCSFGEPWVYLDDEGLAEQNNLTVNTLTDKELITSLEGNGYFMDMGVGIPDSETQVSLLLENMRLHFNGAITEEEYMRRSEDGVRTGLEANGAENIYYKTGFMEFCGADHAYAEVSSEIGGRTMYQKVVAISSYDVMAVVSVTSDDPEQLEEAFTHFYALD